MFAYDFVQCLNPEYVLLTQERLARVANDNRKPANDNEAQLELV